VLYKILEMQILQKIKKILEDTSKKQNKQNELKQKRNLEKKWIYA
jgi:hypothetical protein